MKVRLNRTLTESMLSSFKYELPTSPVEQMVDFYLLSLLEKVSIPQSLYAPQSTFSSGLTSYGHADSLNLALEETRHTLLKQLKAELLKDLFVAIESESENVNNPEAIDTNAANREYTEEEEEAGEMFEAFSEEVSEQFIKYCRNSDMRRLFYKFGFNLDSIKRYHGMMAAVQMAYQIYQCLEWDNDYGGKPWARICKAWIRLNGATKLGDIQVWIDHVYDLQHNTNVVFDKLYKYRNNNFGEGYVQPYMGGYEWIKKLLDWKANATNPYQFFRMCSSQMARLAAAIIKANKNTTFEQFLKTEDPRQIFYFDFKH